MIIVCQRLLKSIKISGIALYPFILVRKKEFKKDKILINHEKIHLSQQLELLIIPFYFWYLLEYSINYLKYKNAYRAYRNISFEKEAYDNDENLDYLKNRKLWNFTKYLQSKN